MVIVSRPTQFLGYVDCGTEFFFQLAEVGQILGINPCECVNPGRCAVGLRSDMCIIINALFNDNNVGPSVSCDNEILFRSVLRDGRW